MRGIPNVLHIDFNHNLISDFNDLTDLGLLKKLCILNFIGNPILGDKNKCHRLPHLSIFTNFLDEGGDEK